MKRVLKDPEERRKELIETAARLFTTVGYEQTAISDIVKEVNVSQGAFYYYFDSKEEVLVAVLEKEIADREKDFKQIAERTDVDEAVKLNLMFNRFINPGDSGRKIFSFIHQERSATLFKKLRKSRPFLTIAPIMADVILKGTEKGRFNVAYPTETSVLILLMLAPARHLINLSEERSEQNGTEPEGKEHLENINRALEDLLGRILGISDYKFCLQTQAA